MMNCYMMSANQMEAAQEAESREMRRVINFCSAMNVKEQEAAERLQDLDRKNKNRRDGRRAIEAERNEIIKNFVLRNFWSVIIFAVVCILDVFKLVNFWVVMGVLVLISIFLTVNFCSYVKNEQNVAKKEEALECENT